MPQIDDNSLEEESSLSLQELYARLQLEDDLILVINLEDYEDIKQGITAVKGKENTKLKNKGFPVDESRLQFVTLPATDILPTQIRIQISLLRRKEFKIIRIEPVDKEI